MEVNFKKAYLKKWRKRKLHIIEIENFGNIYVIFEYNFDFLKDNLELKENEIKNFIKEWMKEGYNFIIEK